jgi:hypothetical protein
MVLTSHHGQPTLDGAGGSGTRVREGDLLALLEPVIDFEGLARPEKRLPGHLL